MGKFGDLNPRKMYFRQHAADATTGRTLDVVDRRGDDPAIRLEHFTLFRGQRSPSLIRHRENPFSLRIAKFEHVSRERIQLIVGQTHDVVTGVPEPRHNRLALLVARNCSVAYHRDILTNIHEDVSVVNRNALAIHCVERDDIVIHALCKITQRIELCA